VNFCDSTEDLFNFEDIKCSINVGESVTATKVGNLKCQVNQVDGAVLNITLHELMLAPKLLANFFSFKIALKNGYNLINQDLSTC
jgi:hypothetical protein